MIKKHKDSDGWFSSITPLGRQGGTLPGFLLLFSLFLMMRGCGDFSASVAAVRERGFSVPQNFEQQIYMIFLGAMCCVYLGITRFLKKEYGRWATLKALGCFWAGLLAYLLLPILLFQTTYRTKPPYSLSDKFILFGLAACFLGIALTLYLLFSKKVRSFYAGATYQATEEKIDGNAMQEAVATEQEQEPPRMAAQSREDVDVSQNENADAQAYELRVFKLPSSGQWYWAAKNRRGQLLARGGPLKTWVECAKQFHAGGYR